MRPSPLAGAIAGLVVAAAALAPRTGSGPPPSILAQPPPETANIPRSPTGTPTPMGPAACGLVVAPPVIRPRILGPGDQAAVRIEAAYDLGPHPFAIRDRIVIVVGPVEDDLATVVSAGLERLAETVELDRGNELAVIAVGAASDPVRWWSGAGALGEARRALAVLPHGDRSAEDWVRAIDTATDALLSGPPTKSTALLVVADRPPGPTGAFIDWRAQAVRLRDALVQRTVVELTAKSWLSTLVVGAGGELHRLNSLTRESSVAVRVLRGARQRLVGLTGVGWHYRLELGEDRWRAFPIEPFQADGQTLDSTVVSWSEGIDAWSGAFVLGYGVAPPNGRNSGTESVVPLAAGRHTLTLRLGARGSCQAALDVGSLCIHRRGHLNDDCGSFEAGQTATAGAPTATPTLSATAGPGETASATAAPTSMSTSTPSPTRVSTVPPVSRFESYLPVAHRQQ
ncbi:MAG: hypothetical protein IPG72_05580 [Ardenticatenales bacterium]|nr:hypothetical protein [Ardenticatenales bacterium]